MPRNKFQPRSAKNAAMRSLTHEQRQLKPAYTPQMTIAIFRTCASFMDCFVYTGIIDVTTPAGVYSANLVVRFALR